MSSKFEAGLRNVTTGKLSVNPAVNGYLFSNWGRIRQRKERDGLRLSSAVPKIQWDSNPHFPMAIRLWETFTPFIVPRRKSKGTIVMGSFVRPSVDTILSPQLLLQFSRDFDETFQLLFMLD